MLIKMSNKGLLNIFGHSVIIKSQNVNFGLGGYPFFTDKRARPEGPITFIGNAFHPHFLKNKDS